MENNLINSLKIEGVDIIIDLLPIGKNFKGVNITPKYITIHNTGNINASALNNHKYMHNINKSGERSASWHFTVGYDAIYQAIKCNKKGLHAGCSKGNNESIGIEICMYNDKERQYKAYLNAIELVKVLMKNYNIDVDNVVRHYDWTKKNCPQFLIEGKYGYYWQWFKNSIKQGYSVGKYRIIVDELNIRELYTTKSDIVGVVHKGEVFTIVKVVDHWGKLKSGVGWISILPKYVECIEI